MEIRIRNLCDPDDWNYYIHPTQYIYTQKGNYLIYIILLNQNNE